MAQIKTAIANLKEKGADLDGSGQIEASEKLQSSTHANLEVLKADVDFSVTLESVKSLIDELKSGPATNETEEDIYNALVEAVGGDGATDFATKLNWLATELGLENVSTIENFKNNDTDDVFDAEDLEYSLSEFKVVDLSELDQKALAAFDNFPVELKADELKDIFKTGVIAATEYFEKQNRVPKVGIYIVRIAHELNSAEAPDISLDGLLGKNKNKEIGGILTAPLLKDEDFKNDYEAYGKLKYEEAYPAKGFNEADFKKWQEGITGQTIGEIVQSGDIVALEKMKTLVESIKKGPYDSQTMIDQYTAEVKAGLLHVNYATWKEDMGYDGIMGIYAAAGGGIAGLGAMFHHFFKGGFGKTNELAGSEEADKLQAKFDELGDVRSERIQGKRKALEAERIKGEKNDYIDEIFAADEFEGSTGYKAKFVNARLRISNVYDYSQPTSDPAELARLLKTSAAFSSKSDVQSFLANLTAANPDRSLKIARWQGASFKELISLEAGDLEIDGEGKMFKMSNGEKVFTGKQDFYPNVIESGLTLMDLNDNKNGVKEFKLRLDPSVVEIPPGLVKRGGIRRFLIDLVTKVPDEFWGSYKLTMRDLDTLDEAYHTLIDEQEGVMNLFEDAFEEHKGKLKVDGNRVLGNKLYKNVGTMMEDFHTRLNSNA